MARPFSGPGLMLAEDEHDQCADTEQLLIAQLKPDTQRKHGKSLDCAGVHANWLRVGFGGYEYPGGVIRSGSWPPNDVDALPRRGLTAVAPSCRGGGRFPVHEITSKHLAPGRLGAGPITKNLCSTSPWPSWHCGPFMLAGLFRDFFPCAGSRSSHPDDAVLREADHCAPFAR